MDERKRKSRKALISDAEILLNGLYDFEGDLIRLDLPDEALTFASIACSSIRAAITTLACRRK